VRGEHIRRGEKNHILILILIFFLTALVYCIWNMSVYGGFDLSAPLPHGTSLQEDFQYGTIVFFDNKLGGEDKFSLDLVPQFTFFMVRVSSSSSLPSLAFSLTPPFSRLLHHLPSPSPSPFSLFSPSPSQRILQPFIFLSFIIFLIFNF
jgi:hypothetical protein